MFSATRGAGLPNLGSVDFSNGYNFSTNEGGYLLGLQAGYDIMSSSRWLLGVAADVSFPSFLGGNTTMSSGAIGTVNYLDQVEFSGNILGRIGYAPGNWLFYATGGFAFSYDQLTRTQLAGTMGGAGPGTLENLFLVPRVGGVVGAGVEVTVAPHWTAQLQYLFTDYTSRSVTFPAAPQNFDSDLTLNEVRLGLNYRLGDAAAPSGAQPTLPALITDNFAVHGQIDVPRAIRSAVPRALCRDQQPHSK